MVTARKPSPETQARLDAHRTYRWAFRLIEVLPGDELTVQLKAGGKLRRARFRAVVHASSGDWLDLWLVDGNRFLAARPDQVVDLYSPKKRKKPLAN